MMKFLQGFWKWFKTVLNHISFSKEKNRSTSTTLPTSSKIPASPQKPATGHLSIEPGKTPSIIKRRETLYFQVGLDFGTSATKIAYTQIGGRGKRVNPISFNHGLSHYPSFCLPSLAAIDQSGRLLLGSGASKHLAHHSWDTGLRRFKVIVAGKHDPSFRDESSEKAYERYLENSKVDLRMAEPEHLTATYLAFAMRTARKIIQNEFKDYPIDLSFNICMPIDHTQQNDVCRCFEKIIATAEAIETEEDNFKDLDKEGFNRLLDRARVIYPSIVYLDKDPKTRVFAIPEAVAVTASYVVSLKAVEGLHAIIDFGAGTTDVSIFNLLYPREADVTSYWYAAKNLPRGSRRVEKIIADYLQSEGIGATDVLISDKMVNAFKLPETIQFKIRNELKELWEASKVVWRDAYKHKKKQSEWMNDKVQIFYCGGGANLPFVKEIFRESWMDSWGPYAIHPLPDPEHYDSGKNKIPFIRLAVAYGLTIPKPELGGFILPADAPDQTPPELPVREVKWWDKPLPKQDWV